MNKKTMKAVYGKVALTRAYCVKCQCYAFVLDGKLACCNTPITKPETDIVKKMLQGSLRRELLSPNEKRKLLEMQKHKCFYCDCDLNSSWYMGGRMKVPRKITIQYDHVVPWVFSNNDDLDNFVAACNVCNMIKKDRIFPTIDKLREWILWKREDMNYEIL